MPVDGNTSQRQGNATSIHPQSVQGLILSSLAKQPQTILLQILFQSETLTQIITLIHCQVVNFGLGLTRVPVDGHGLMATRQFSQNGQKISPQEMEVTWKFWIILALGMIFMQDTKGLQYANMIQKVNFQFEDKTIHKT